MSSRNMSSRPASAVRSSVRATPASSATFPTRVGSTSVRRAPSSDRLVAIPSSAEGALERVEVRCADDGAGGVQELGLGALGDDPAVADHHDVVGDDLDLVQQVGGQQDGAAAVGVAAEQVAHPADAGRVQAVGGLVEDQHLGVADQGGGDAEPLAHPQRVVADPSGRLGGGEADDLQHLLHAVAGKAHVLLGDGEDLAAGATGVLGGGVEEHADLESRVGQVDVVASGDGDGAGRGSGETDHDPHRGRLPGPVGSQESGHATRLGGEADVVDRGEAARTSW